MEKLLFQKGKYSLSLKTDYDRFSFVVFPTLVYLPTQPLDAFHTAQDFVLALGKYRLSFRLLTKRFLPTNFNIDRFKKEFEQFLAEFNQEHLPLSMQELNLLIQRNDTLSAFFAINPPKDHYGKMLLKHFILIELEKEREQIAATKDIAEKVKFKLTQEE